LAIFDTDLADLILELLAEGIRCLLQVIKTAQMVVGRKSLKETQEFEVFLPIPVFSSANLIIIE